MEEGVAEPIRDSRVKSSTMMSTRKRRPSASTRDEVEAAAWLAPCGRLARPVRPPRRRTVKRSSRVDPKQPLRFSQRPSRLQDVQAPIAEPPAFGSNATQPLAEPAVVGARGDIALIFHCKTCQRRTNAVIHNGAAG